MGELARRIRDGENETREDLITLDPSLLPVMTTTEQSLLITLVSRASHHGSRILAIMFGDYDVRNFMLSGFRYVLHAVLIV